MKTNANEISQVAIVDYARQMFDRFGGKALAIAARRRQQFEEKGHGETAQAWRRIQLALTEMRGSAEG